MKKKKKKKMIKKMIKKMKIYQVKIRKLFRQNNKI